MHLPDYPDILTKQSLENHCRVHSIQLDKKNLNIFSEAQKAHKDASEYLHKVREIMASYAHKHEREEIYHEQKEQENHLMEVLKQCAEAAHQMALPLRGLRQIPGDRGRTELIQRLVAKQAFYVSEIFNFQGLIENILGKRRCVDGEDRLKADTAERREEKATKSLPARTDRKAEENKTKINGRPTSYKTKSEVKTCLSDEDAIIVGRAIKNASNLQDSIGRIVNRKLVMDVRSHRRVAHRIHQYFVFVYWLFSKNDGDLSRRVKRYFNGYNSAKIWQCFPEFKEETSEEVVRHELMAIIGDLNLPGVSDKLYERRKVIVKFSGILKKIYKEDLRG